MAITHINSSFKIKAGGVKTTLGTVPEPGAIVFHNGLVQMFYADGFNWIPLQQQIDSLAAEYVAAQLYDLQSGVAQPLSLFDTEIYIIGSSMSLDIPGGSITFAEAGDYQFNINFEISADSNNTTINTAAVVNGTPLDGYDIFIPNRDQLSTHTLSYPRTLGAGDVMTFQIQADGNNEITMANISIGVQKII